jgi:glycosyltransferase involved in cell wall biosynthesis
VWRKPTQFSFIFWSDMKTVSLCMIVKNEQKTLERCLKSIKSYVDEIVIVDSGSTDDTLSIAKKFTNKIYHFEWCDDFSKARNFAFSKATSDYVMWLDADDVVPRKTLKMLVDLKPNLSADVYMLKYDIAFSGKKPTFSYFRERIMKNCDSAKWQGCVHECIAPFGRVERLNYSVEHRKIEWKNSDRNYKIYKKILKERELSPREQYYFARELFDHKKYKSAIKVFGAFVNSKKGWVENVIDALFLMSVCYEILGETEKELSTLFETFKYDLPRANVCCKIGDYFLKNSQFQTAIYWYNNATKCQDITAKGGFVETVYYNYYPYLQLCVCHYNLRDVKKAIYFNEKAGKCVKNSKIVENNRKFFAQLNK